MLHEPNGTALSTFEQRQIALHCAYYHKVCLYKARFLAEALAGKRTLLGDTVVQSDVDHLRNRYYTELRRHRRIHEQPGGVAVEALVGRPRKPPVRRLGLTAQARANRGSGAGGTTNGSP